MKFKKFTALICAFAFMSLNLINVSAKDCKIVLLGDAGAGKTQFYYGTYNHGFGDHSIFTVGARHEDFHLGGNHIEIWDVSGQEQYRYLVPTYLRDANVVVFVVDITNQFGVNGVNVWNVLADQHCPGATKVLVVNKVDLEGQVVTVPRDAIARKADELGIRHIFYVSAKTPERNSLSDIIDEINASSVVAEPRTAATAAEEEGGTSLAKKLVLGTVGLGAIGFTAWGGHLKTGFVVIKRKICPAVTK